MPAAPSTPMPPQRRPEGEPVTAGVVDDNADFGEYLAFRQRKSVLRPFVRDRDIGERYRLTVHDAAGRVVPDAVVSLHAGSQPRPLWARTDTGGQVWLHPRAAGIADPVLEVRVHKAGWGGGLHGSALLRRGQRDALQIRLDAAVPAERARLDLVFLVDATGSMGDEIDKLKRSMGAIADQIARLPSQPDLCFGLVAYRDRGDEFFVRAHDLTDDLGAFQQVLGGLRAAAGGDYPEALNEALHTAVHRLSWRGDGATRLVVMVADAPPHLDYGSPWYDDDMQGALARGIKLFAVGASGLDPIGEFIHRQIAQFTGGRFVFLTYAQAHDPSSGPGRETVHDVGNYSVETLDRLVVRLVREELARRPS
jgi:Mg-chelatase subunit ChlD